MLAQLRNFLIGPPLPTEDVEGKRLDNIRALAVFSPGALSSIAYANQEIYLGLVVAGVSGLNLALPIGLAISALLAIVALSYYQTLQGYPSGGGSYAVARDNFGPWLGLITAAALMIDYLLTAAVSLTASVDALASAFPGLWDQRVSLALLFLLIITIANLRGFKETGTLMSIPVYLFLFTFLLMLVYGLLRSWIDGPAPAELVVLPVSQPLSAFLVLHAFSTGCTALTGIEAISNGVPTFKSPEVKNAGKTLIVMALLMGILFLGSIGVTQYLGVVAGPQETILSALAHRLAGNGLAYFLIQAATMLILAVAANTSFAGFPRLAAILAADGFLPRQLTGLGDRLVFQNGILFLSAASAGLILLFKGDTHALIPLFAVGAFLAYSVSQAGMVRHWWRERSRGWLLKSAINGLGSVTTLVTLVIVAVSKFMEGAWITVLLILAMVFGFSRIRSHYREVASQLTLRGLPPSLKPTPNPRVAIPISGVHRGIIFAVNFARSISSDIFAVYVELEPGAGERVIAAWQEWFPDIPIEVVPSPYRSIVGPLLGFLDEVDSRINDGRLTTVILPEFIPAHWWQSFLHNQTAWILKMSLLYRRHKQGFQRVIIDIPYHLKR